MPEYEENVRIAKEELWRLQNPFRVVRELRKTSTQTLAEKAGLKHVVVLGVENEYTGRYTVAVAVRIADALGVSAEKLLGDWARWLEDHPSGRGAGRASLTQIGWFGKS